MTGNTAAENNTDSAKANSDPDYPRETTDEDFDLIVNMAAAAVTNIGLTEPEYDESVTISPPNGVVNGDISIDYYYGIPALYVYEPHREEPVYVLLLPTKDEQSVRTLKSPAGWNTELREEIEESEADWRDQATRSSP